MAALATTVLGRALGQSTSEKSFRNTPSKIEDFASYGLLFISLLIIPKTVTHWQFINCNYCDRELSCGNYSKGKEDPGWTVSWVEKLCSDQHFVQEKFLFSTYALLLAAILLLSLGNYMTLERAKNPLNMFCSLLVKEKILDAAEFSEVTSLDDIEALEIIEKLRNGRGEYFAHSWRKAMVKIILGLALLCVFSLGYLHGWHGDSDFICLAEDRYYQCLGNPGYFLDFTVTLYSALLIIHVVCNLAKIIVLLFPRSRGVFWVMIYCLENVGESKDGIDAYYGKNRDMRMFLDFLHDNYGLAQTIAAMALFDENFREHLKPRIDLDFDKDLKTLRVWSKGLGTRRKQFAAEISPPAETRLEILERCNTQVNEAGDVEMEPLEESRHTACFAGLKDGVTYSLTVWRLLDGKKIIGTTQVVETTVEHKGLYPQLN